MTERTALGALTSQGACDCHAHVFGPADRFPTVAAPSYPPPTGATAERLRLMHQELGVSHGVVVQPLVYGFDHRLLEEALRAADGRLRGVGLISGDEPERDLAALHESGVRAVRVHLASWQQHTWTAPAVARVADRAAELGWHLELHLDPDGLERHRATLAQLTTPIVIDHMANIAAQDGPRQPAVTTLLELAAAHGWWIKLSGVDRCCHPGTPLEAGAELLAAVAEALPDQVVWGTDWPHTEYESEPPADGRLFGLLQSSVPEQTLESILVRNPHRLYRWPETD